MALNKPSIKVIFFKNFSVFTEILEGSNNLKNELTKPSIYFLFSKASIFIIIMFIYNQLSMSFQLNHFGKMYHLNTYIKII